MQIISSLVLIVSVILICQMMDGNIQVQGRSVVPAKLQPDGFLLAHPEPTEELGRDELIAKLNVIEKLDAINAYGKPRSLMSLESTESAKQVVDLLYRAKDKQSTDVYKGFTVAGLIELNNFNSLASCSKELYRQRLAIIQEIYGTMEDRRESGLVSAIDAYASTCLHLAADHCVANRVEVIKQGINDKEWMRKLQISKSWALPTGDL